MLFWCLVCWWVCRLQLFWLWPNRRSKGYTVFRPGDAGATGGNPDYTEEGQWWGGLNGDGEAITVSVQSEYSGYATLKVGYMTHSTDAGKQITVQTFKEFSFIDLTGNTDYLEGEARVALTKGNNNIIVYPTAQRGGINISYIAVENLTANGEITARFMVTPVEANATVVVNGVTKTAENVGAPFAWLRLRRYCRRKLRVYDYSSGLCYSNRHSAGCVGHSHYPCAGGI